MRQAAIFNNKIQLIDDFTYINISLIVPFGNLQKMKDLTGCAILSTKNHFLSFNHYAGNVAKVNIRVKFSKIAHFLEKSYIDGNNENYHQYIDLIGRHWSDLYYSDCNLISNKIKLYAFGEPITRPKKSCDNIYIDRTGKKRSFHKIDKYVKFKGQYFRKLIY